MNTLIFQDYRRLLETLAESDGSRFLILEAPVSDPAAARVLWTNSAEMLSNLWPRVLALSPEISGGWDALLRGETVRSRQRFSWNTGLSYFQATLVPFGVFASSSSAVRFGLILQDQTEQEQAHREIQDLMTRGHCLLWRALVTLENGSLVWQFDISNLEAALQWLPIRHQDGDTLIYSWASARAPAETERMDSTSRSAILSGAASYAQEFEVRLADGQRRHVSETVRIERVGPNCWNLTGVCTDATERYQAEVEARDIMVGANCLIWHADIVEVEGEHIWDLQFSNTDAALEWLPIPCPEGIPLGWAWAMARPPEESERTNRNCDTALRTGQPGYVQEFLVILENGKTRLVHETVQLKLLEPGHWHAVGVCTDATERHEAEGEMRKLLTNVRCLIWHADVEGNPAEDLQWNLRISNESAVQRWLPISVKQGQTFLQAWEQARLPEDQQGCDHICAAALQTESPGFSQEFRVRLANGQIRCLAEDVQVETLGPGRWHLVGVCTDITERKAEQEALSGIITRAHCLVWHASVEEQDSEQDGGFAWDLQISNSESVSHWLAIEPLPGQAYTEAWYASRFLEDNEGCDRMAAMALRGGASSYRQEFRCRETSGRTRWLAEDVSIEVLGPGRWQLVGVCTDITERRTLEEERERMLTRALEQADRDPLTGLLNHRAFHAHLAHEADRAQRGGSVLGIAVIDLDNFKFFNDAYGHLSGDDVLRQVAAALQGVCRSYDTLARFGGDEFAVLMPGAGPGDVAHLAERLSSCLEKVRYRPPGASSDIPLSLSVGMAVFPLDEAAPLAALHLADERLLRVKSGERGHGAQAEQLRASLAHGVEGFSMLDALVVAVDNKDRYTRSHSEDVLFYCLQIADALALEPEIAHPLQVAALLHDVGKIGIPDHILRKPGKLTEAEYGAMQQHPVMGAAIVAAVPGLEGTLGAVRHHHERWDGLGYPDGLAGEATPLEARIMAVADAFSAMTTDRPYRKGMVPEEALAVLEAGAGTQWDPRCVHAFLQAQRQLQCLKANIPLLPTRGV